MILRSVFSGFVAGRAEMVRIQSTTLGVNDIQDFQERTHSQGLESRLIRIATPLVARKKGV